ncbi:hypothetical protein HS327_01980 [Glaesserella parasuis]|uniref:hypothetical protein n=1 Tax=Glaesserella parasuis TaxID=738 RepID=UPI0004DD3379|nr:hypothetical protein [Glaesserella parasuis]KEZ17243.1 hypothetical protein HS327_01980 [Glaesserella parasuis]
MKNQSQKIATQRTKTKPKRQLKSVEHFTISYDASDEEYAEHKINAHNLVKIIQDTINLVERSDKLLNGSKKTVDIYLQPIDSKQIVKEGSIQIPFAMEVYEYMVQTKDVISSMDTVDVLKTIGWSISAVSTGYGLFKGIFSTQGEPVLDIKTSDNSDIVEVLTENTKVSVDEHTAILMKDSQIRQAVKDLTITPLISKDNGVFKILRNNKITDDSNQTEGFEESVTLEINPKERIEILSKLSENIYPEPEEKSQEAMIMITQLNFYSGKTGWKMKFEDRERSVELQDISFINLINANQASFRKGDWLKVNLKIVKNFGLKTTTSYVITEVLEHLVSNDRKLIDYKNE